MTGDLTIGRWIDDRAALTPDRIAIDFPDHVVTFAELARRADALAAEFTHRGLTRGARVAVLSENRPEYVDVAFACAKTGLILVPLNWRLTPPELAFQLDDADVGLFVVDEPNRAQADAALALAAVAPAVRPLREPARDGSFTPVTVADGDPLFLIYTSGTTGRPKGALITHANTFWTNLAIDRIMDVTTFDVVLQVLPQFHIGGWNVQPLLAWWKGATVVLEPAFDPDRALDLIAAKGVTTMMGVPATYLFMAESSRFAEADLSSLRTAVVGGAPMPEPLIQRWHARGVQLIQGYGLTEASPNVLGLPAEDVARKIGYAGKPYPHVEVGLRDTETGEPIDGPGLGELVVRGPSVFGGYWRNPDATAETIVDGWLRTGDIAERDDEGFYRIRDRVKDMYISGGENVYPAEVESVLAEHPAVLEAAVVGVAHDRWGEVGRAVIVLRVGHELSAGDALAWCRERLAPYKVPRHVVFVDALPRSAMNKILKRELAGDITGADR
ncbi:MAG TPA: long-chain fatty acid--CoA ligase [Acidimicrobiia bacterium]|nr:long-chain fatty acid--CoA ligase [Acidimicrobiia bacterium]